MQSTHLSFCIKARLAGRLTCRYLGVKNLHEKFQNIYKRAGLQVLMKKLNNWSRCANTFLPCKLSNIQDMTLKCVPGEFHANRVCSCSSAQNEWHADLGALYELTYHARCYNNTKVLHLFDVESMPEHIILYFECFQYPFLIPSNLRKSLDNIMFSRKKNV